MARYRRNFGRYTYLVYDNEPIMRIRARIEGNLRRSLKMLRDAFKAEINVWGSIPYIGNWRFRLRHSRVGSPPLKQTMNLINSIDWGVEIHARTFNFPSRGMYFSSVIPRSTEGIVGTDVPYAPSLEFGGLNVPNARKPHTTLVLVNPIRRLLIIGARPFWRRVFHAMIPIILNNLQRGGSGYVFKER